MNTIDIENEYLVDFAEKMPLSFDKGSGIKVWDESGAQYTDFTSGWAVTSLGYGHPAIVEAVIKQGTKMMQGPNASLTYSPARAQLLLEMMKILPANLGRVFFTNSGAEANDAAMKLARKITKRKKTLSASMSFHGRTLAATSATAQAVQQDRYNVLVPYHEFFTINDSAGFRNKLDSDTAAVIIEPIQGEGGINIVNSDFLCYVRQCCRENGTLLIIDEIQTGFFRTGPAFLSEEFGVEADFLTMAKGIAGGFPLGAVAVTEKIASEIEQGDHGGTYNGNPLGCAIAAAVIKYMIDKKIGTEVSRHGIIIEKKLAKVKKDFPRLISDIRGKGLLWAIEFTKNEYAGMLYKKAVEKGLLLNLKHGRIIRLFPALIINDEEVKETFDLIYDIINSINEDTFAL